MEIETHHAYGKARGSRRDEELCGSELQVRSKRRISGTRQSPDVDHKGKPSTKHVLKRKVFEYCMIKRPLERASRPNEANTPLEKPSNTSGHGVLLANETGVNFAPEDARNNFRALTKLDLLRTRRTRDRTEIDSGESKLHEIENTRKHSYVIFQSIYFCF